MPVQEKEKLSDVINKVKTIANESYDGKVYDNILNIFADLTIKEQRTLLKGLINICFIVETQVEENTENIESNKNRIEENKHAIETNQEKIKEVYEKIETVKDEIIDIDAINKVELIKLKTFLTKALIVLLIMLLLFAMFIAVFFDGPSGFSSITIKILEITKEIF